METIRQAVTPELQKAALRRALLGRRRALAPAVVAAASAAITARVLADPAWDAAEEILAYLPVKGEVDTRALVERALVDGRRLLLPRCRDGAPGELDLGCITCLEDARPGHFGILEPAADHCHSPETFNPDLLLIPAVAYDLRGHRLGFGGGYYDRLLALPMAGRAHRYGLAYAFQLVPEVPAEAWDRPVETIITEQATHRIAL